MLQSGMSGCFTPTKVLQQKAKSLCAAVEVQMQHKWRGHILLPAGSEIKFSTSRAGVANKRHFKKKNQAGKSEVRYLQKC